MIGTGIVGRTLAQAFVGLGHDVVVGTRDPAETGQREEWAGLRSRCSRSRPWPPAPTSSSTPPTARAASPRSGGWAPTTSPARSLVDVANPLDFSAGFPPTLSVKDTDSLAEQIQRAFPEARVVKSLNTVTASVMVDPGSVGDGDTSVFVAGDDAAARAQVRELLESLGWRDVIELDGLQNARGLEMWLPLWVRLMGAFGTPTFNLKLVR